MNWPWCKREKIRCPDGSFRFVYKNLDDAFPLAIRNYRAKIREDIELLRQLNASGSIDIQSVVAGLYVRIDKVNSDMQMDFKALYSMYQNNPCENEEIYAIEIRKIIQQHVQMRKEVNELSSSNVRPIDLESAFIGILDRYTARREARPQIEPNKGWKDVEEWKRRN